MRHPNLDDHPEHLFGSLGRRVLAVLEEEVPGLQVMPRLQARTGEDLAPVFDGGSRTAPLQIAAGGDEALPREGIRGSLGPVVRWEVAEECVPNGDQGQGPPARQGVEHAHCASAP